MEREVDGISTNLGSQKFQSLLIALLPLLLRENLQHSGKCTLKYFCDKLRYH